MDKEELMKMAEDFAATSCRNRVDTSNPAFGFNARQLADFASAILERAALECLDTDIVEDRSGMSYYAQLGDAVATKYAIAGAIRALKPSNDA